MNSLKLLGLSLLSSSILIACGEAVTGSGGPKSPVPKLKLNDTGVTYQIDTNTTRFFENTITKDWRPDITNLTSDELKSYEKSGSPFLYGVIDTSYFPKIPFTAFQNTPANLTIDFPGQDASIGNDVQNPSNSDGQAGFSFVKLNKLTGAEIFDNTATEYGCVKDNVTGLIWEHKTKPQGLNSTSTDIHRADLLVSWFNQNSATNGGIAGQQGGGVCPMVQEDTNSFMNKVNKEKLCGIDTWRLPTIEEMRSLINYQVKNNTLGNAGMVDLTFFPYVASISHRWSSQSVTSAPDKAFGFHFHQGKAQAHDKNCEVNVDPNQTVGYENGVMLVYSGG